jgi:hypothetical protein
MLIRSRNGALVPASKMSPLIRGLKELWDQDIHLYAFAEVGNQITTDDVLRIMDVADALKT